MTQDGSLEVPDHLKRGSGRPPKELRAGPSTDTGGIEPPPGGSSAPASITPLYNYPKFIVARKKVSTWLQDVMYDDNDAQVISLFHGEYLSMFPVATLNALVIRRCIPLDAYIVLL